jgi:hypothetical protein
VGQHLKRRKLKLMSHRQRLLKPRQSPNENDSSVANQANRTVNPFYQTPEKKKRVKVGQQNEEDLPPHIFVPPPHTHNPNCSHYRPLPTIIGAAP